MTAGTPYHKLSRQQLLTLAIALEEQRDRALAKAAYQQARAEYFKYAPEIVHDPEGVRALADELLRLGRAMRPSDGNA